ncbi:hypothetical protein LX86_007546 [Lentzea aerocolonigenes]|nr:hypothetical protein [Lentzea aerocolonigenes]
MHDARPCTTTERVCQDGDFPLTAYEQATSLTHDGVDETWAKRGNHASQQIASGPNWTMQKDRQNFRRSARSHNSIGNVNTCR